ncbi:MAG: LPS export ABC transporter periplasmic protein LptC [candidate division KSB1 bacterium]|nr:LPS export ABC transporter periplasmic protein LptC [candidate division KSB1 bacterium]
MMYCYKQYMFLIAGLFLISFSGCSRDESSGIGSARQKKVPDQEMWNFRVKATNQGQLNAIIQAGYMQRYADQALAMFKDGVEIDFYQKGEHTSRLTSDSGRFHESNMNVRALGHVEVHSDSGISLYTQELVYDQQADRIYSNVDVKVTTLDGDTLSGKGFESDAQLSRWQIINPHDGVYHKPMDLSIQREKSPDEDSTKIDTVTEPGLMQ